VTAIRSFAEFVAAWHDTPIAPDVLHHAKRALVDWAAAWFAGAADAPARLLASALADEVGHGDARLADGRAAGLRAAALINGTAAHTAEVDDIYREAIYHPGAPTIAAALALAVAHGLHGGELLRALVAGYEVSCRIGAALGRRHYRYWHNTGTVGTFGAAAAAACLLRLDAQRASHALATAATMAAGLQQAFRQDSMSKPLHAGRAAEGGLLAALAASEGLTGSDDMLDGDAGLGVAMSDGPDWRAAVATLGHEFLVTQMTFKNHACCGHTFAAIDGALALQRRLGADAEHIEHVRIATYGAAVEVAGNPAPRTAAEARFSLAFVVATALRRGRVRLAAFTPEALADAGTRALMQRIETVVDPELDAAFPGRRAARVAITTRSGHRDQWLQPTRHGDPDSPLSDADLDDKFVELASPQLGELRARQTLQRLWAADTMPAREIFAA